MKRQSVQHFLRARGRGELANQYAFDLSILKRLALNTISFDSDLRLVDTALEAVGVRTDEEQKLTVNPGESGEANPHTSRSINLGEYENLTVRFKNANGEQRFLCDLQRNHSKWGHQFVIASLGTRPAVFTSEGFPLLDAGRGTEEEIVIELTGDGVVMFIGTDDAKLFELSWLESRGETGVFFTVFDGEGRMVQQVTFSD